jgi:regulatory protein
MTLRDRALALLARREHSRVELARKLALHGDPEEVAALLDDLQRHGQLSDARFAESLAHTRAGKYGSRRLAQELREKGVGEALTAAAVQEARVGDLAAARSVWQKKFGTPPADAREKARQYRFLLGRGFPSEIVRRVVGGSADED